MPALRHSPTFRSERAPLRPLAAGAVRIAPGLPSNPLAALAIGAGLAGWSARQLACRLAAPDRLPLSAGERTLVADAIEDLLQVLDAHDGDPDLEDGADDESSLCGIGGHEPSGMTPGLPVYNGGTGPHPYDLEHDEAECGLADLEAVLEVRGLYA